MRRARVYAAPARLTWVVACLGALVAPATPARGGDVLGEVTLEAPAGGLEEGRPARVTLRWCAAGDDALLLLAVEATPTLGRDRGPAVSGGEDLRLVSAAALDPLAPGRVTLELAAEEDLGPIARAPRPPLRLALEGEPCVIARVVAPGEALSFGVPVLPRAGLGLELQVRAVRLVAPGDGPAPQVLVRGATWTWSPGAPAAAEVELLLDRPGTGPLGRDRPGAPDRGPEPAPFGAGGADPGFPRVGFTVQMTRWVPRGIGPAREVLLERAAFVALPRAEGRRALALEVRPAPVPLADALARAGLQGPGGRAVRVGAGWALEVPGPGLGMPALTYLPDDGARPGAPLPGDGFAWAYEVAERGRARLECWSPAPDLTPALEAAGARLEGGKGLRVEVTPETFAPVLAALARLEARIEGRTIVRD